jgi:hypothetical protein
MWTRSRAAADLADGLFIRGGIQEALADSDRLTPETDRFAAIPKRMHSSATFWVETQDEHFLCQKLLAAEHAIGLLKIAE